MNRSFQLEPKDRDPLHAHVRGMCLSLWDSAREDGDKRHNFDKVKVLLDEVVSRISDLTPNRNDLREQLAQAVDADHIVTMLSKGAFNAEEFVRTVVSVSARLLQLEAPAYNSNTRQWLSDFRATMLDTNNVDMWAALRSFIDFVHAKVDQIALGAANYRLTMLIPFVEQHGLDYLRAWIEAGRPRRDVVSANGCVGSGRAFYRHWARARAENWGNATAIATAFFSAMAKTCWFGSDIALPETLIEDAEAIQTLRRKSGIMLRAVYGIMRISQILAKYAVDDRNGN